METIKSIICPWCKSEDIKISAGLEKWYLFCNNCGNEGALVK